MALETVRVVETLGLQRRKGVWSRSDAAEVLLMLGRLDEAGQIIDEARQLRPQGIDAFRTDLMDGQLWLRRGDLDRARSLLERAETAGSRIIDPHLVAPLYADAGGDRRPAGRRRGRGPVVGGRGEPAGPGLPPRTRRAGAGRGRHGRVRADPPRREDARALLDRAAALLAATPAPGTPAEVEVRRGRGRAVRRRDDLARRGRGLGADWASPTGRRTPTCGWPRRCWARAPTATRRPST